MRPWIQYALMCLACSSSVGSIRAQSAPRSVERILREIGEIARPTPPQVAVRDADSIRLFSEAIRAYESDRAILIRELLSSYPAHPKTATLLREYWSSPNIISLGSASQLISEANDALATIKDEKTRIEAYLLKARMLSSEKARGAKVDPTPAVEDFLKAAPKDQRGPALLYGLIRFETDEPRRAILEDRILETYPDAPVSDRIVKARRQRELQGKPFELEFKDAIEGRSVSIKGLAGKVVVVDFWATWCAPCVAEMPKLKKIYAEFHNKGVEFIGVSLDQTEEKGGLKALRKFVAENDIPWPQYYQGNYWQSEFSKSWGINAIPALFVIDQGGKVYSVEGRGKIESIITELLAKNNETKTP